MNACLQGTGLASRAPECLHFILLLSADELRDAIRRMTNSRNDAYPIASVARLALAEADWVIADQSGPATCSTANSGGAA